MHEGIKNIVGLFIVSNLVMIRVYDVMSYQE
jgi:hypothetical protein